MLDKETSDVNTFGRSAQGNRVKKFVTKG